MGVCDGHLPTPSSKPCFIDGPPIVLELFMAAPVISCVAVIGKGNQPLYLKR